MSGCEIGTVVVVGATGAVGREVLGVLEGRGTPAMRVRAVASERSAGQVLAYGRDTLRVERCTRECSRERRL